jgi:hypothetical protein
MPYNLATWLKRIRSRSDISAYVTHLTRETDDLKAVDVLIKILKEQKIIGSNSNGFIQGSDRAVCFQDAPLYGIAQNLLHEQWYREELGGKVRYRPFGLSFEKTYVFKRGGRPVIYEQKDIAQEKFANELWRVVTFDLSDPDRITDWTHEREWRVKGDFHFSLEAATVLLTNKKAYSSFIEKVDSDILKRIGGIVVLDHVLS